MRPRLLAAYLLLVLLPLTALIVLGVRLGRAERATLLRETEALLEARLADVDARIAEVMEEVARDLDQLLNRPTIDWPTHQELARRNPRVRQLFWADAEGRLTHPAGPAPVGEDRADFIQRTMQIWVDRELWRQATERADVAPPAEADTADAEEAKPAPRVTQLWGRPAQSYAPRAPEPRAELDGATEGAAFTVAGHAGRESAESKAPPAPAQRLRLDAEPSDGTSIAARRQAEPEGRPLQIGSASDLAFSGGDMADAAPAAALKQNAEAILPAGPPTPQLAPPTGSGWVTWFWGKGLNFIYWRRLVDGRLVGVELERSRMLAEVISGLPDTAPGEGRLRDGRIALIGATGDTLYQWGGYEPTGAANELKVERALQSALRGWRLEYVAGGALAEAATGRSVAFGIVLGVSSFGLVLIGLALYFYLENTRALREAAQRVSFVNRVSHELKTPLTNIRMYAELMEAHLPEDDDRARRHLGIITGESRRLSRLIGNVLTFSRGRRGRLRLHPRRHHVDDTVRAVLDCFRPSLEARGLKLRFEPGADGELSFDADALEQILGNLLSNVEKYAADGGWVEVCTRAADGRVEVEVRDNGPGIDTAHRVRIFEAFYRISNAVSDGVSGTGIGLTISRELARRHGGDLELIEGTGGAAFRLILSEIEADGANDEGADR